MFNIYLGIYIIFSITVLAGGTFTFIKNSNLITAVIYLIGSITVFVLFGLKWFSPGATFSESPVSWPPTINTCPDYLVHYNRTMPDGTIKNTCIDLIGVSKNGSLKIFPKGDIPSSDEYYFSLSTQSADTTAKNTELCQRAIANGLTWEGITNGESCIAPSGTVAPTPPNNNTANCPQN